MSSVTLALGVIAAAFALGIMAGVFAVTALSAIRGHRAARHPDWTDRTGQDEPLEPDESDWAPPRWPGHRGLPASLMLRG